MGKIGNEKAASSSCPEDHGDPAPVGRLLLENAHEIPRRTFLLASCLTMVGACCQKIKGQIVPNEIFRTAKKNPGKSNLLNHGIDQSYEIVIADAPTIVEVAAAEMLQGFLEKRGLNMRIVSESKSTNRDQILIGLGSNLRSIGRLRNSGELKISNLSAEDDGFELKRVGRDIVIAGVNPRGALYGVYAFEDFLEAGENGKLDAIKTPNYRKRGSGLCYTDVLFDEESIGDISEEKVAYLSRLGINQFTDQGIGGNLRDFVTSDVFQFQKPPRAGFQRKVRALSSLCRKYGIDLYIFLNEPALPQPGDLDKYPREALGTVRRPWGGGADGIDRTLCVSSPIVQRDLRNMMRKFVREYPDVKGAQFYNLDVNAWLCTPELCPRCKSVCTDSPPNGYAPWETQARLVTLLAESAHEENPDFAFRFWGAAHYHGERFKKLAHAAQGYNSLLSPWTGSDRTVMVPAAAKPDSVFVDSKKICQERAIPFYLTCEFNNLEVVPRSLPFPLHVIAALKKYKQWEVGNLAEIFGLEPEHNPINALVMREFYWNPDQNPKMFLSSLAYRQFGSRAGELMYQAWEEIGEAFDVWNDVQSGPFPLEGSQFQTAMGVAIGGLGPAILPDIVKYYNSTIATLVKVEPWLAAGYQRYKGKAFRDKMSLMSTHLAQAVKSASQAVTTASDKEFIGICYYQGADGRPTCQEYSELNHASIAIADILCRQRCDILDAYHLLTELEDARGTSDKNTMLAKEKLYRELIRKDIGVQEYFCELLTGFAKMQPCYRRTSLTDREISGFLSATRTKIERLGQFLARHEGDILAPERVNRN